ncbi:voltage-gated potassium channel subunit beta-2 [Auriculariales sp. MPI-PUGE-AT-0066]|nr:voltage-gated potassium channel subunit beta-2 [Auriculariales sp. MPI-PUGE-AT-0066]
MEYQRLGSSGLKISKIILGCMSYGSSKWQGWILDEDVALPLFKAAYDAGITTWDTANIYSNGESERLIRKAIEKYNIPRNRLVILSKVYFPVKDDDASFDFWANPTDGPEWNNNKGLSRKHILDAVDASVARLGTYIDVLQIHRFDPDVPAEEIMEALHDVVKSGKVRYIGASSMFVHQFATLQFTAEKHGWTKFISMQNYYNLIYREEEREMIPFCNNTGVGLIPWSPLARGALARAYGGETLRTGTDFVYTFLVSKVDAHESEINKEVITRVEKVAKDKGTSMACVATAWVLGKNCAPILGLNSVKRIEEAVASLKVKLTDDEIKYLEESYAPKRVLNLVASKLRIGE